MTHDVPESDWKIFRELEHVALERFCKRVLEMDRFRLDESRTHHQRYLDLYRWLQDRDEDLARAFNDPSRSRMLWQLAAIHAYGLLEPHELARFTSETRDSIQSLAGQVRR